MRKVIDWYTYNMNSAIQTAERSKDPNTQVGAYICDQSNNPISRGYNGFPRGIEEREDRWERPTKHKFVIHAEMNALLNALNVGRSVDGCNLYTTLFPCSKCALMIIQAGIKNVFYIDSKDDEDTALSRNLLFEAIISAHKLSRP